MDASTSTPEWQIGDAPVGYADALAAMQARIAAVRGSSAPELVWLLEHPPLYTAGTSATPEGLVSPDALPIFRAGRGGQWTYHGPGQRVGYVMLDLDRAHGAVRPRDIRAYVEGLEEWLIRALDRFNVRGRTAVRARRHLGGRSGARHGKQDRCHRRTRQPLGDVAWCVAERGA